MPVKTFVTHFLAQLLSGELLKQIHSEMHRKICKKVRSMEQENIVGYVENVIECN